MEISENELWILSYYRESELAGALVMGRLAQETDDDDLRAHLTEHCAEEAAHAWLWTTTILEVGGTPRRVAETYQARYLADLGPPASVLEVLALTHVFEKRVLRHFKEHLRRPGTHPAVARALQRMIEDEAGHLGWVKRRLDLTAREKGAEAVAAVLRRHEEVDGRIYAALIAHRNDFGAIADPARRAVPGPNGRGVPGVERRVLGIAAAALHCRAEDLALGTRLGDLAIDSLTLLALIAALEDAFGIELDAADAERLETLGDLAARVIELTRSGCRVAV